MRVHFIASGGSALPGLFVALFYNGCQVNDPDYEVVTSAVPGRKTNGCSGEKEVGIPRTFDEMFFRRNADCV